MTSESRWRSWDGVLRFLNTATRLQKTPGILPKLRLVRVSLEAWAWLYLVAYLQVAILLTLQKYHLETGSLYFCISLYSAWLQRPVTQLPSSYFPNHFDRNGVWLRSHQSQPRQQNAVNQHFNKWYKMECFSRVRNYMNRASSIWLSPISSNSGYLGHYHSMLTRCKENKKEGETSL